MTDADHEAFARRWAQAIVGTSYVSMGRRVLTAHLLRLTHQLAEAALAATLVRAGTVIEIVIRGSLNER